MEPERLDFVTLTVRSTKGDQTWVEFLMDWSLGDYQLKTGDRFRMRVDFAERFVWQGVAKVVE